MRQIVTTANGDIDVLKVQEKPDPTPGNDEVVIKVRAAGLNFADILARQGLYPDGPPKPCVMGYEVSGVVESAGKDVNSSFAGKSVVAMTRFGGQSELVAVKATQMFEKPERLTFEQAAAIPVNYLTAYALLVVMGSLHAGESVLIHNAGGGVGLENTRQRLTHLYGGETRLELLRDGDWTRLVVELPFHVLANVTPTLPGGAAA